MPLVTALMALAAIDPIMLENRCAILGLWRQEASAAMDINNPLARRIPPLGLATRSAEWPRRVRGCGASGILQPGRHDSRGLTRLWARSDLCSGRQGVTVSGLPSGRRPFPVFSVLAHMMTCRIRWTGNE
jgi:hypothetical protein